MPPALLLQHAIAQADMFGFRGFLIPLAPSPDRSQLPVLTDTLSRDVTLTSCLVASLDLSALNRFQYAIEESHFLLTSGEFSLLQ